GYEGISLDIAPDSGFVYVWGSDTGMVDRNLGRVTSEPGYLSLSFLYRNKRGDYGFDEKLVPVRWAERVYLVPPERLLDFCNDISSEREPRARIRGGVLLRKGDEDRPTTGLPDLP